MQIQKRFTTLPEIQACYIKMGEGDLKVPKGPHRRHEIPLIGVADVSLLGLEVRRRMSSLCPVHQEACFLHRISIRYTRSLFFAPNAFENASRTPGGCF